MKDVRFYLEYPSKREKNKATRKQLGNHSGNCLAVFYRDYFFDSNNQCVLSAVGAVQDIKNNPCCFTSASPEYVSDNCKRISEAQAREIHPNLFQYLEQS